MINKNKLLAILIVTATILAVLIHLVNNPGEESVNKTMNETITSSNKYFNTNTLNNSGRIKTKLVIDEIFFYLNKKRSNHTFVFVFDKSSYNIIIINMYFPNSIITRVKPRLPFKISENHNRLTVTVYSSAYKLLDMNKSNLIKRIFDRDKPLIIYKDPAGSLHKEVISLYKYFIGFVMKYYYSEYDFDIDHWDSGEYNHIGDKWVSCTYLYLKSYSDKPIHIYLIKLYLYDKHHKLLRIIDYKENLTLKPNSMIEVKLCFQVHVKGIFNVEQYGRVYVYSREGIVRTFEQFV